MNIRTTIIAAVASALLAGCSADGGPKETSGAIIGGVAGGLIGNTIGEGNGRAAATIVGAALGAVVGSEIGRGLDDRDREHAFMAVDRGLRSNRVEYWKNPDSGHRGRFRPVRSYMREARECRDFEHTIWVRGEPEIVEGTACERADGSWRVIG